MSESFTCCCCGVTFNKCWSDQEAMAELRRISAEPPVAVVCDDCWRTRTQYCTVMAPRRLLSKRRGNR